MRTVYRNHSGDGNVLPLRQITTPFVKSCLEARDVAIAAGDERFE